MSRDLADINYFMRTSLFQETPVCESKKNGNQRHRRLKSSLSRRFGALSFWQKKLTSDSQGKRNAALYHAKRCKDFIHVTKPWLKRVLLAGSA